jgi:hypothetical protein
MSHPLYHLRRLDTWLTSPPRRTRLLLALALAVATLGTFAHVCANDFVNYDDDVYVTSNLSVLGGLTPEGTAWAFTSTRSNHWHPLTWLSLQLDAELYGEAPWGYHLTNLLLHTANVLLLFLVWSAMTNAVWRSAAVAAFFALHPLHVESVAWVTERKDVLSTLFWLLTMAAYVRYARKPGVRRYLAILAAFALGLMAKSMLVTLPGVLLLLDYWPLRRFSFAPPAPASPEEPAPFVPGSVLRLVGEKVPLFLLALGSAVASLTARHLGGGLRSGQYLDLGDRVGYVVLALVSYLGKTFYPASLAVFYPLRREGILIGEATLAAALLVLLSLLALGLARRKPWVTVGWFWYLGTLLPVSGLVQVGSYALADRYTYIPLIGIFVLLVWGLADLVPVRWHQRVLAPLTVVLLLVCMTMTWQQVRVWRNSVSLWEHTLAITSDNFLAQTNLGTALLGQGRREEAREHLAEAARLRPDLALAHLNLGRVELAEGRVEEAIAAFQRAVDLEPQASRFRLELERARAVQRRKEDPESKPGMPRGK